MKCFLLAAVLAASVQAQSAQPAFEVASIRPHEGPLHTIMGFTISGTLVRMEGYNLPLLLAEAYKVKSYALSLAAVPRTDDFYGYYDLTLRVPGNIAPTRDEARKMLQTLLADRFKLTVHRETHDTAVYALVLAKDGPKLKTAASDDDCAARSGPRIPTDRNYQFKFIGCPIDTLVGAIGNLVPPDRPVVDKTGLTGKYDIIWEATPDFKMRAQSDPGDITVFSAVQTLGLKLESQRSPIEMIVVDHVEKLSDN